ncbi:MAG: cytochrome ubiquinol oxidase subunit I [Fibrobacteres bacterium]|nr:cytochrome ubiquinol oxidase subunit I [Fibrobacterota bacterium]
MFVVPIPYLANELGWAGAEIGRQPWIIYKVLRTSEASSLSVPMWQTAATIIGLILLYTVLLAFTLFFLRKIILSGPEGAKE